MKLNYFKIAGVVLIATLAIYLVVQGYLKQHCQSNYGSNSSCYLSQYTSDQRQYSYEGYFSSTGNSVQNVYLDLKIKEFSQTQTYLNLLISKYNGKSISLSTYQPPEGIKKGTLVFEIPTYFLQSALTDLRNLGQVKFETISGYRNSNSGTYYYTATNVDQLKQEREQWLQRYTQENDQETAKQIEAQLARLAQEIQAAGSYTNYIPAPPEVVTITVNYIEDRGSFAKAYQDFIKGALKALIFIMSLIVSMVNGLIRILIYLLPVIVWIGLISLVIYGGVKMFKKDRFRED